MNNRRQKVKEFFKLAFELSEHIEDMQIAISNNCNQVHAYTVSKIDGVATYGVNFSGYYSDWCTPDNENSIETAIKQLKVKLSEYE